MCGRFSLASDPARLALELDAVDEASAPPPGLVPATGPRAPRYNIAPTTTIPVLTWEVPRGRADGPEEQVRGRRHLFLAIAQAVVEHLHAHPEAFVLADSPRRTLLRIERTP